MSTILNTNGTQLQIPTVTDCANFRCAILKAEWNERVTDALCDGARETLLKAGVDASHIEVETVPGTVELVNGAALLVNTGRYDAVIVTGCVIRGDTPHFDYVCMHTTQGVATLNALGKTPVIFGVLTVENMSQATDRAGGRLGNKGAEAAVAAIRMSNLHKAIVSKS